MHGPSSRPAACRSVTRECCSPSKTLAATMVDLYEQPAALKAVRAEFEKSRGDTVFKAYIPEGPPPVPAE